MGEGARKILPFQSKWGLRRWIDPDTKKSITDVLEIGKGPDRNPFAIVKGKALAPFKVPPSLVIYNKKYNPDFDEGQYHIQVHPDYIGNKERFLEYMGKVIYPMLKDLKKQESGDVKETRERGDTLNTDLRIWDAFFTDKQSMPEIAKKMKVSNSAIEKSLKRTYEKIMGNKCYARCLVELRLKTGEAPCSRCDKISTPQCIPDNCGELSRTIGAVDAGDLSGKQKNELIAGLVSKTV